MSSKTKKETGGQAVPSIPGVIRRSFDLKGQERYSYHIVFQRGSRDKFTIDLTTLKERDRFQKDITKRESKADVDAYRTLDDIFRDQESTEAFELYLDGFGAEASKSTSGAKLYVKVKNVVNVMGVDIESSVILEPTTKEHRNALSEYFAAKAIIRNMAKNAGEAETPEAKTA